MACLCTAQRQAILREISRRTLTGRRAARAREDDGGDDEDDVEGGGDLNGLLIDALRGILDELETVYENVAKNAKDHIHSEYAHCSCLLLRMWL